MQESPIFVKTFDFLKWVVQRTETFPKSQRFGVAKRLNDAVFDFYEFISQAAVLKRPAEQLARLREADARLVNVMHYLRLSQELHYLSFKQYGHASLLEEELGRLLGSWIKKTEKLLTKTG